MAFFSDKLCNGCGKTHFIQNKAKHLCSDCVFKLNHDGKSRYQVAIEKQKKKKVTKKPTGERKLHLEIWEERPHFCSNCYDRLEKFCVDGVPPPILFSHRKSKGSRGDLRLNKENFDLLCPDCHYAYEFRGTIAFQSRKNLFFVN